MRDKLGRMVEQILEPADRHRVDVDWLDIHRLVRFKPHIGKLLPQETLKSIHAAGRCLGNYAPVIDLREGLVGHRIIIRLSQVGLPRSVPRQKSIRPRFTKLPTYNFHAPETGLHQFVTSSWALLYRAA